MKLFVLFGAFICMGLSSGFEDIQLNYGDRFRFDVPDFAEYLEYVPTNAPYNKTVLWRRSGSPPVKTSRGTYNKYGQYYMVEKLTQEDMGDYILRRKGTNIIYRKHITVSEHIRVDRKAVGEEFSIYIEKMPSTLCQFTFQPYDGELMLIVNNDKIIYDYFGDRMHFSPDVYTFGLTIEGLLVSDSGFYEVRDKNKNLAMEVKLDVLESIPVWFYIAIAVALIVVAICCRLCIRRWCCRRSASNPVPQTQQAPAYVQHTVEPTGPTFSVQPNPPFSSSYAYQPVAPSFGSQMHTADSATVPSPLAEAPATGAQRSVPKFSLASDFLSSESQFETNEATCPLSLPLHSESTTADVYMSDKLNFL